MKKTLHYAVKIVQYNKLDFGVINLKYIKSLILTLLTTLTLLSLSSCSPSEPEKVTFSTSLDVSSSFSGSRTFRITYPNSLLAPGSEDAETLERLIRTNCPSALTYTSDEGGENISYTFTLAFSSFSDYTAKLTDILGAAPGVTFSNPNTPLTKGWRIDEGFQSSQLMSWLTTAAHAEQIDTFDYDTTETETNVTFNNSTTSTTPAISVNNLTGSPVKKITLNTVNHSSSFDRTITFTFTQSTFDSLGDKLTDYFKSITDTSAVSEWLIDKNDYNYIVTFENITLKQLEGYTNRLFSSVYGDITYLDKTVGSTALAYQNSYTETLDFSNYIGENSSDVPVEYTYSIASGSMLDSCLVYSDFEWNKASSLLKTDTPGEQIGIKNQSPSLTLRINDGKQYVPESIDITLTPLDGENITKTYSFVYDIAEDGYEACDYTASYFEAHSIEPIKDVIDGTSVCTITFTGAVSDVNTKTANIFGVDNLITYSSQVPFLTLRTNKHFEDHINLSSLLVGQNEDTPVSYTLIPRENELAHSLILSKPDSDVSTSAEQNKDGNYSIKLAGCQADIKADISLPDIYDIIIFCAISLVMLLITMGLILLLRSRKPIPALPHGTQQKPAIPKPQKQQKLPPKTKNAKRNGNKK